MMVLDSGRRTVPPMEDRLDLQTGLPTEPHLALPTVQPTERMRDVQRGYVMVMLTEVGKGHYLVQLKDLPTVQPTERMRDVQRGCVMVLLMELEKGHYLVRLKDLPVPCRDPTPPATRRTLRKLETKDKGPWSQLPVGCWRDFVVCLASLSLAFSRYR